MANGRHIPLFTLSLFVISCHPHAPNIVKFDDPAIQKAYGEPHYGDVHEIRGKVNLFFEVSSINMCRPFQKSCNLYYNPNRDELAECWLEMSEKAVPSSKWENIKNGDFVRIQGRVTISNGIFGHLGQYPCQVEVEAVLDTYSKAPPGWGPDVARFNPIVAVP
ncbi:hypothetical protein FHS51_002385 [Sphingobium wenxiniae]|uniref:hypothetical protein n=1 Tax=Sphingobium TaxID=165695 RepID=UPI0011A4DDCA|nr:MULTISPECIES: hypothetical protein [Sphingobium]MBB6192153.1 hypothetical protein [Sphingobium wenxiniae]WRD75921.1 hypothetical protein QQ987_14245 [Sphingobium baderi]